MALADAELGLGGQVRFGFGLEVFLVLFECVVELVEADERVGGLEDGQAGQTSAGIEFACLFEVFVGAFVVLVFLGQKHVADEDGKISGEWIALELGLERVVILDRKLHHVLRRVTQRDVVEHLLLVLGRARGERFQEVHHGPQMVPLRRVGRRLAIEHLAHLDLRREALVRLLFERGHLPLFAVLELPDQGDARCVAGEERLADVELERLHAVVLGFEQECLGLDAAEDIQRAFVEPGCLLGILGQRRAVHQGIAQLERRVA